jgi:hypothetical protein
MQFVRHFTMLASNFIVEGRGSGLLSRCGRNLGKESPMNGEQSRLLATGNRVCWDNSLTDRGTIAETDWSGVEIVWDNGRTEFYLHNDMATVIRVPVKG